MSLITLTSRENETNPNSNDPAILRNHFKDGIKLKKGDQIGLVSLTFNKLPMLEVIQGENDTFTWRIGNAQQYLRHQVTIPPGVYTGATLATQVAKSLNDSTILGNYKGKWTCVFDPQLFSGTGGMTIQYGQNEVPAVAQNDFTLYEGNLAALPVATNGAGGSTFHSNAGSNNFSQQSNLNIFEGARGIFPNGGRLDVEVKPILGVTKAAFEAAFDVGGGGTLFTENRLGVTRQFSVQAAGGAQAAAGWDYEQQFDNGDPSEFWYFKGQTQEGAIGVGDGTANPAVGANLRTTLFYNLSDKTFRDAAAGGRGTPQGAGVGEVWSLPASPTGIDIVLAGVGYASTMCGPCRSQLRGDRSGVPTDPDKKITTTMPDGFDYIFRLKDNATFTNIEVSLSQLLKRAGIGLGNPGWRQDSRMVFQGKSPDSWNTGLAGTAPANWTNFVYGTSNVKMSVLLDKVTGIEFKISHDGAGAGVFEEEVSLGKSGQTPDAVAITRNIQEHFYPYLPIVCPSGGGRYSGIRMVVQTIADLEVTAPTAATYTLADIDNQGFVPGGVPLPPQVDTSDIETPADELAPNTNLDAPANAQTLGALAIYGTITDADIAPAGPLQIGDVPVNRSQNNIANLLGLDNLFVNNPGQAINTYQSAIAVDTIVREPNLMVELTDFNIEGHNGDTSDKAKIIAVIPAEELNTNTRTGQLNYYAHFPIMIDLNIEHDLTTYDLNAVLRTPDGKIADDLVNPTSITLLKEQSMESKQRRIMGELRDDMISSMANRQEIRIDAIGRNNPRI